MSRYEEAMEFLLGPCVNLYTNAERSAAPCPACGATQGKPCESTHWHKLKRGETHTERRNLLTPRSEEDLSEDPGKARPTIRHGPRSNGVLRPQEIPEMIPRDEVIEAAWTWFGAWILGSLILMLINL